jgi:gluconolactonase
MTQMTQIEKIMKMTINLILTKPLICIICAICVICGFSSSVGAEEGTLADRLKGVRFEQFAKAPGYSEGPTWRDGELFFCSGALLRVRRDGKIEKYLDINPAGTVLRGDGHLLICDNKHRALLDLSPDGKLGVLADKFEDKPLRSLNDLTIDARGNVYWTDPEGSSKEKPIGSIFRVRPDGTISKVASGLAFPNGLDVDPAGKFLYVIESQSKKILRYPVPADDEPLGKAETFFDLGGSGGDGCVFDAEGNFWVADYHRPETKRGRITILSPAAKVLATLEVPAEAVSNISFGGKDNDEIFCTTGNPAGVFRAKVGVKGFKGHPGKPGKVVREIPIAPRDPASAVHPRRFGLADHRVETIRGWYIWKKWDPDTWEAEVTKDPPGEVYHVRVLPWATTYRHLVYGARPDDLLPGERVNLFFAADEHHPRGYLVYFQDELCQMKGHGHVWEVRTITADGFTARVLAAGKPLDGRELSFRIGPKCKVWRTGKIVEKPEPAPGDRIYLTWCLQDDRRVVFLMADDASLEVVKKDQQRSTDADVAREGMAGQVEGVEGKVVHFQVFAGSWAQAGRLEVRGPVRLTQVGKGQRPTGPAIAAKLVSRKNRGSYGSGVTDVVLELVNPEDGRTVAAWGSEAVIRLIPGAP